MTKGVPFRPWTPAEERRAQAIFDRVAVRERQSKKRAFQVVADELHRGVTSVRARFYFFRESFQGKREITRERTVTRKPRISLPPGMSAHDFTSGDKRAPDCILAERDRRNEAADARDLTGFLMGDPLRGYSALDCLQKGLRHERTIAGSAPDSVNHGRDSF